jgi:hypothetical protein
MSKKAVFFIPEKHNLYTYLGKILMFFHIIIAFLLTVTLRDKVVLEC